MKIVDINTFYYASDGGVKTFYDAKIEWFKKHPEHQYYLIYPNSKFDVEQVAPNVHKIRVFGLKGLIGKDRRLMFDYWRVFKLVRMIKPDILEIGDPMLTPIFACILQKTKFFNGILANFHHSDPLTTYLYPWAFQNRPNMFKKLVYRMTKSLYTFLNKQIPHHMTASRNLKKRLNSLGIQNITVRPFGVPEIISTKTRIRQNNEKKLIFAGRLEHEKGIYQLKDIILRLLERKDIHVSVMGKGTQENFFKSIDCPNYTYYGYVKERERVAEILYEHTIFLAPGPYETFGIGVLEALSSGMIVIGPASGGTGEILDSMQSQFIFKPQNSEDFYQAILRALNSDLPSESLRSLKKADDFSTWDRAIDDMMMFYFRLASIRSNVPIEENNEKNPDFVS